VLVEGDGSSMTSDEAADIDDDGSSVDAKDEGPLPHKPAATATTTAEASQSSSLTHAPSAEDLSAKKKPQSRIAALVQRTPAAGKSKQAAGSFDYYFFYVQQQLLL